jgi:regulator of sirC expression with transglutaminase-like and TPR domain
MPGNVLIQIGERDPVVVDPFAGGGIASQEQVAALCRACFGAEGEASARNGLRMSNRAVLARLLNNQAVRAEDEGDTSRALTMYRRMTLIAPATLDAWRSLARLQLAFDDVAGAKASLLAMSEVTPDRKMRNRIMDAFAALDPARPVPR